MSKQILVTGGAGYIGSHVCKALARQGYTPVTIDNLVNGHEWAVKWGPLVKGDIADRTVLDRTMREYQPSAVIHLAAFAYVGESVEHPAKYYRNNLGGALSLLESMVENHVDKIVFSSSCATYGLPESLPISESHPQKPINPYGRTKLMIEQMLQDFGTAYGIRHISLRYFNAAGADPEGEIGEVHEPETHLIPNVLKAAYGEIPEVSIFGDSWATQDGTCVRDYIHVSDLADAHVRALAALDEIKNAAFNLGTGSGNSVMQIIRAVETESQRAVPYRVAPPRAGDPPTLVADASQAKKVLGWTPQSSDLMAIIRSAHRWYIAAKKLTKI